MSSRWISISLSGRVPGARGVVDLRMDRLDQGRLAHAAGAPEQGVVGRQAAGEALGVLDEDVAHPVDAAQQAHLDPVDLRHRREPAPGRMPHEGIGGREIGLAAARAGRGAPARRRCAAKSARVSGETVTRSVRAMRVASGASERVKGSA